MKNNTLQTIKKLFTFLFPKNIWLAFIVVLIFFALGDLYQILAYGIANYLWILYSLALAVILHEAGHFFAARLSGERPWRVTLGKGHRLANFSMLGAKIVINTYIFSGAVHTLFQKETYRRSRRFLVILGGPAINLIIAALCLIPWPSTFISVKEMLWITLFGSANLLMGVINLIPYKVSYMGMKLKSDGAQLLSIPFMKESELLQSPLEEEWLRAYDLLEDRHYQKALAIYAQHEAVLEAHKSQYINIAVLRIKLGEYAEALSILKKLEDSMEEEQLKPYQTYIYHNLAYVFLLLGRVEDAYAYTLKAKAITKRFEPVESLHAYVLIEMGQYKEAMYTLEKKFDKNFVDVDNISRAMYLASAYKKLGKDQKAQAMWNYATQHQALLETDSRLLYSRIADELGVVTASSLS